MTDVLMITTETEDTIQMGAVAAVVVTIAVVIYVHYIYVIHVANAVEETYVLVSRR